MPAPSNANGLSLGRPVIDATTDDVQTLKELLAQEYAGAGYPCGAQQGDAVYMAVYAQPDGEDAHILYGGNPTDPLNPIVLTVSASGSATVIWQEEGSTVKTSGTVNFVGDNVTVTDEGDGKATVTITGGGGGGSTDAFGTIQVVGQSDVVADAAPDIVEFIAGFGFTITTNAGSDAITWAFRNGDGLESDGGSPANVRVKAHTYVDVTSDGVAVDFTEVASYNGAGDQYLRNNAGSFQWATLPPDTNTTYTAGAGINLSGTKFVADPNNASHVGLVDPSTGDDSAADDAQIGILWHEIANYDVDEHMLVGHESGDATKPVVCYKTVEDWLKTLPGYDTHRVLVSNEDGDVEWYTVNEMLDMLTGRNDAADQSIGANAGGSPAWQDDTDECPE